MSDTIYKIIPESYSFYPIDTQVLDGAVRILKSYLGAEEEISWKSFDSPQFIDCGSNFETVACPLCGKTIPLEIWQGMMDSCYKENGFSDLHIMLPCCKRESTLNDLKYEMDCGFANFVIEIVNPVVTPRGHDLFEASKCFGKFRLKMIIAKY